MRDSGASEWGLNAIAVFYIVGIVAAVIALFGNRAAVGEQLASVHGLPVSAGLAAFPLTIAMGILVAVGINSRRPWGYWVTTAYMAFLLVLPPLTIGKDHISLFANVFWPAFVVIFLFIKRRRFGVGFGKASPVESTQAQ